MRTLLIIGIGGSGMSGLARMFLERGIPVSGSDRTDSAALQDLARLGALVDDGRLRVPVDRTFPLSEVAAAHRHVESAVRGKVVVTI